MENQKIILCLIRDDLVNTKLVKGLGSLGLESADYFLQLSEVIFELLGFDDCIQCEAIYEQYLKKLEKVKDLDIKNNNQSFERLAKEIYDELLRLRGKIRHQK